MTTATETREEQLARLQRERIERAATEGEHFDFQESPQGDYTSVFNPASGRFYIVTEHSCSCPDHQYRAAPAGLVCKHVAAYLLRQEARR